MSVRRARARRPRTGRTRRGLRTTAIAVTAMAALTASQAPGLVQDAKDAHAAPPADDELGPVAADGPVTGLVPPGDGSYHTELPPLKTVKGPAGASAAATVPGPDVRAQSGVPATVLRAYRAAEASVGRTDPACRLPWELLAAIGRVESGQARGGAVDRNGTTRGRITGPPLNGQGFALIRDTDGGAHDGDTVYDRAVGPMQFLPSTWALWGTDGNGDGRSDPNNIFDAALAAGHYLCAGDRNLSRTADLDRAILSYNYSSSYLKLVRYWLEFYSRGVHTVPDGKGVIPESPGAGGDTPATRPVDGERGGGGGGGKKEDGIVIGPDPGSTQGSGKPSPERSSSATSPGPTSGPASPTASPTSDSPSQPPGESPTTDPSASPDPTEASPSPTDPDDCSPETATPSPESPASPESPDPSASASPSTSPCPTVPAG
ncbi:lytic transglycosylase domain-containing protein [Streptomyces poonensis]|uniref:Transglycosylase SLT domain-containing protein n=1 Tax=Streptomyces poonensis TaxID=68255 RepID=A0A918UU33_9ACTN|nr:lytic murein transglycosylase [Streptomyces poonensis]GGZ33027.1 hypothetical protein GCM10010365_62480 [Streptomyces poonensis]GLJ93190.1 hypothetical protein GCM10017589_58020 [Streptomyces poonensis]